MFAIQENVLGKLEEEKWKTELDESDIIEYPKIQVESYNIELNKRWGLFLINYHGNQKWKMVKKH